MASQSRGPEINATTITFTVVSVVMVLVRFVSRKISGAGFWWDDWLILLALGFTLVDNGAFLASVTHGYGLRSSSAADQTYFLKSVYLNATVGYNPALPAIKISILLFMLRVFPTKGIRKVIHCTLAFVVAWWIALEIPLIFQCSPVEGAWDKSLNGKCIDVVKIYIAQNAGNSAVDILILGTPLPSLWTLQMKKSKRFIVCGILCVGLAVTVCSIARLVTFATLVTNNLDWTWVNAGLWSIVEPNIAILCACLPALGPLIRLAKIRAFSDSSCKDKYSKNSDTITNFGNSNHLGDASRQGERVNNWDFHRLEDGQNLQAISHLANSETLGRMPRLPPVLTRNNRDQNPIPLDEIHVRREVVVSETNSIP